MVNLKNDGLPNRRAKIVCTLGPATDSLERVIELVEAGMNVARLNMSHGDHDTHLRRLRWVRQASESVGRPIGVFADLQGPKIRLGKFPDGPQDLEVGDRFTITTDSDYAVVSNGSLVSTRRRSSRTTWVYDQPEPMAAYLATLQAPEAQRRPPRGSPGTRLRTL